jgi:hydrogenase expression/formation protein HypC
MCLGIPSKIVAIDRNPLGMAIGRVEAAGVVRQVCMDYVPEAQVGDFVMVQMGFAVSRISETEASDVMTALDRIVDLSALDLDDNAGFETPVPRYQPGTG